MKIKISLKKTQLLLNILFTCTFVVWLIFDFMRVFPSILAPATHLLFFEGAVMLLLGLMFGTIREEPWWVLIVIILTLVTVIYGVLFQRGLLTVLGINLYLFGLFLFGHFLQRNRKIVKVEKA